jgi:hypothetical protein
MGLRPTQGDENRPQVRSELVIPSEAEGPAFVRHLLGCFSTERSGRICFSALYKNLRYRTDYAASFPLLVLLNRISNPLSLKIDVHMQIQVAFVERIDCRDINTLRTIRIH